MFVLVLDIQISKFTIEGVNHVEIDRSVNKINGTAKIKLPTSAILRSGEEVKTVQTAKEIKRGDKVGIKLGYDNQLFQEFEGFVTFINYDMPLVIECEDNFFILREKQIAKSYKETDLNTVLTDILESTGIDFETGGLNLSIEKLLLATSQGDAISRDEALKGVFSRYGLTGYFDSNGKLFVGLQQGKTGTTVKYKLGWNTIDDTDLKFHKADEIKLKVKAVFIDPDGSKIEVEAGDENGAIKTLFFYDVKDTAKLKELAENELKKYKFDGFSGSVKTFLQPFSDIAMIADITDNNFPDRTGKYFIEGVKTTFGESGGRKKIEIGAKIS